MRALALFGLPSEFFDMVKAICDNLTFQVRDLGVFFFTDPTKRPIHNARSRRAKKEALHTQ